MTIISGTDFSENAAQAARAAAAIAQLTRDPLKLVHVLGRSATELPALAVLNEPLRELLASQAKKLGEEFGIDVEPVVLEGAPDERLVEFARGVQARLLVVSSLGSRMQDQWLVGSVAERVVQASPVPVLVVRDAANIQAWARGDRPLRIVLGVDLGYTSRAALRWVEKLRAIRPCDVRIVQIAWPIGEHTRFGIKGPIEVEGLRPELRALLERDLRAWVGTLEGDGQISYLISPCWGRFDTHLTTLTQEGHADLLVVGTHQRSWSARVWQSSISRGAIHYGSSNVACIPSAAALVESQVIVRYRSVLVPTDFSTLANRAIAAGYGLLAPGGEVHLLHVFNSDVAKPTVDLSERLHALIPAEAEARGITTHIHLVDEPEAWSGIWHAAARLGVDVICMSTHGRSGASQLLLGSQAHEVVRRARQPVLLVKGEVD